MDSKTSLIAKSKIVKLLQTFSTIRDLFKLESNFGSLVEKRVLMWPYLMKASLKRWKHLLKL